MKEMLFEQLDKNLRKLGQSDSSVEYASHIRGEFDEVLNSLNELKRYCNVEVFESECYFDSDLNVEHNNYKENERV